MCIRRISPLVGHLKRQARLSVVKQSMGVGCGISEGEAMIAALVCAFGAVVLIFTLAICKASGDADRQAEQMRRAMRDKAK